MRAGLVVAGCLLGGAGACASSPEAPSLFVLAEFNDGLANPDVWATIIDPGELHFDGCRRVIRAFDVSTGALRVVSSAAADECSAAELFTWGKLEALLRADARVTRNGRSMRITSGERFAVFEVPSADVVTS